MAETRYRNYWDSHMVNHAYTLIYNRPGEHLPASADIYDIYIPPYDPIDLADSPGLLAVERALYDGNGSQEALRRCAAFAYAQILHSGEFSDEIAAIDTRVTYPLLPSYAPNPMNQETYPVVFSFVSAHGNLANLSATAVSALFEPAYSTGYAPKIDAAKARGLFENASTYIDRFDAVLAAYVDAMENLRYARSTIP